MFGGASPSAVLGAVAAALVAGSAMYGTMLVREKVVIAGVRQAERNAATVACNARVAEVTRAHDAAIDASVDEALAAVEALTPTPAELAALQLICDKSLGCRSRRVK